MFHFSYAMNNIIVHLMKISNDMYVKDIMYGFPSFALLHFSNVRITGFSSLSRISNLTVADVELHLERERPQNYTYIKKARHSSIFRLYCSMKILVKN